MRGVALDRGTCLHAYRVRPGRVEHREGRRNSEPPVCRADEAVGDTEQTFAAGGGAEQPRRLPLGAGGQKSTRGEPA